MRERTTWDRENIIKQAGNRVAEDPRAMNQDHLKQQPAADKYVTGDPSDFAEDVAKPNWKAEYSGGEVKRNEIGMPEMRSETFSHPEKTAAKDDDEDGSDDFLEKKANVCIKLARRVLTKTASDQMIEDQALAFMHMPDSVLIDTANRLASQDEDEDEGSDKEAAQDQDDKKQSQQQQDEKKQSQQDQQDKKQAAQDQDEKKQSQDQDDKKQSQQDQQEKKQSQKDQQEKQAQQQQDDKKQSQQQQDEKKQSQDQEQKKEAQDRMAALANKACQAFQQGDMQMAQQTIQDMVQQAQQQTQQQQAQQQQPMDQMAQQIQDMVQQAMGQQQQQQPKANDDQLLDQMLQQPVASAKAATSAPIGDIELTGAPMDVGEVKLGNEDEALTALFASHNEVQEAAHAQALQTGMPVQAGAGMTRTAAMKTVGTRPNGGVSQLGGGSAEPSGSNDIDKLSGLWQSAPDVSSVFGS